MSTSAKPALDQIRIAMARTNDLFNKEVFAKRNVAALDEYLHLGCSQRLPSNTQR